jgi:hypothetical protein
MLAHVSHLLDFSKSITYQAPATPRPQRTARTAPFSFHINDHELQQVISRLCGPSPNHDIHVMVTAAHAPVHDKR